MKKRYFVQIRAEDRKHLRDLAGYDLDVFSQTARQSGEGLVIDGLLAMDDVARLVEDGYQVTVMRPADAVARGKKQQAVDVRAWMEHRRAIRTKAAKKGD